ncbi:putative succinate dehydrogenase [membrane anchor subunit] (succinic dehydrogenase) [Pseudonocardia sp. Ae168_Ps1]|uniref:hypothetical protein n=1 Tax=unclassified Pseudonocardia TaxID=2619320 RepID=UPI00094ACD1C|nr:MULTISPECIES: hypothetical protein [unclassified Pseudonocardia]OLL76770.1 putative succinate dehydrogenase [membrane anchor subunit] (succinic dehydrogenase) [Pseudonocardia sp. Ae150A_Ps1]OLL82783.1 putative succinate dehydrogenase [membrane anchor subunit] (succinic dehydrogenase) [Pseudonocardia sp. Ae168_Ps1]OLL83104.1 putative succinate dehydrogenase [membrane anchor subunit] (succinic dehydrogenase) [Pseudonocardia sp. Ae263_Ps1]OLL90857.1 putative succinate dehydrogenase [membrane an
MSSTTDTSGRTGSGRATIAARTLRTDRWWLPPLATFVAFVAWVAYATVRAFMQDYYYVAEYGYLTPFYSPCASVGCVEGAAHFGRFLPDVWWLPYAAISLPFLLLFRLTCYYYRKAYYRAFWLSPPACAVAEPHQRYTGETRFPLILQNAHRYFFYIAGLITLVNAYDAVVSFAKPGGGFGLGLGNIILVVNVVLLFGYTLSCHSCRSAVGGRLNHFSKHPVRYKLWTQVSKLNTHHMGYAWATLVSLALTDFYVMAVSAGWISDLRIVG